MELSEAILRRLLVSKTFLASNAGQLTPHSDGAAVAKMVLTAHDAAELAAAAIAEHVEAEGLSERTTLVEYPAKIVKQRPGTPFPGQTFLRQLNDARKGFKHAGVLPNPGQWFRVIETTWSWVDAWCRAYLDTSLEEVDLDQLLDDERVRDLYEEAKGQFSESHLREALECLGKALFHVLGRFPGILHPIVGGSDNTHTAILLAAFGVRPGEFLRLQEFLPHVIRDFRTGEIEVSWDERGTGHRGNWTTENVAFCLREFVDTALKVQLAPAYPYAVRYEWVFDDVISPVGETADLWAYVYEPDGMSLVGTRKGRRTVRKLQRGERLRCSVSPADDYEPRSLLSISLAPKTVETAEVLAVFTKEIEGGVAYVFRNEVMVDSEPKDEEWARAMCPHLY